MTPCFSNTKNKVFHETREVFCKSTGFNNMGISKKTKKNSRKLTPTGYWG